MYSRESKISSQKETARTLLHNNHLPEARELLASLCEADDADAETWHLLAGVNGKLGLFTECEACARKAIALQPGAAGAYINLGNALYEQSRLAEASDYFRQTLELRPNDTEACNMLGVIAQTHKEYQRALQYYQQALDIDPAHRGALLNSAVILRETGKPLEALTYAVRLAETTPADAVNLCQCADVMKSIGSNRQAHVLYQQALKLEPDNQQAHDGLGHLYAENGQYQQAIEHFGTLSRLVPDDPAPYANLGRVFERVNKRREAKTWSRRAIDLQADNVMAQLTLARLEKRDEQFGQANARLRTVIKSTDDPHMLSAALLLQGTVLDRLGKYDAAYQACCEGKRITGVIARQMAVNPDTYLQHISDHCDWFTQQHVRDWPDAVTSSSVRAPVFFVAFPRSGTTLVEKILLASGKVVTTSERMIINSLINEYSQREENRSLKYPEWLATLSSDDVEALRKRYWELASDHIGRIDDDKILIDKLPLNIIHIGAIHRIFPDAKILFALRDPRDVCLSCFMQAFALNPAMANFLSLESSVHLYARVMDLWLQYRKLLELNIFEWHYENLVSNFEVVTKDMMEFLGLPWSSAIMEFHKQAPDSHTNTPSYHDIGTPVYTRSTGRWRNYQQYLLPVADGLARFIDEFGYAGRSG